MYDVSRDALGTSAPNPPKANHYQSRFSMKRQQACRALTWEDACDHGDGDHGDGDHGDGGSDLCFSSFSPSSLGMSSTLCLSAVNLPTSCLSSLTT